LFSYCQQNEESVFINFFTKLSQYYNVFLLFILSWYFIAQKTRIYKIYRSSDFLSILKRASFQIIYFGVVVYAFIGFSHASTFTTSLLLIYLLCLFFITLLVRGAFRLLLRKHRVRGGNLRNIMFIDNNSSTRMLVELLKKRKSYGMSIRGIFLKDAEIDEEKKVYPFDVEALEDYINKENINMIYFSIGGKLNDYMGDIQRISYQSRVQMLYISNTVGDLPENLRVDYFETIPVLANKKLPLDNIANQVVKRVFDLLFSTAVIVGILSWLYPVLALLIRIDSKGPILFVQDRNGLNGKTFRCFKFRTMKPNSEAGIVATEKGDKRITRLGRILRKTSIDELPQFFNVFLGDMSIVGPRPHMVTQDNYYNKLLPKYCVRYYVKPGITGLSQVSGLRGEIKKDEDMEKRALTDMYYVQKWSILLDGVIVFKTVFYMVVGDKNAI